MILRHQGATIFQRRRSCQIIRTAAELPHARRDLWSEAQGMGPQVTARPERTPFDAECEGDATQAEFPEGSNGLEETAGKTAGGIATSPDRPTHQPARILGAAVAVVLLALIAAVVVGIVAGWRALAVLPAVLLAVGGLVDAVVGRRTNRSL